MGYAYLTLAQAIDALAAKLYDPLNQFWSVAELQSLISEALRTWNALTGFWRAEFSFPLLPGVWWYDLATQVGSARPRTLADANLLPTLERHLLEPPNAAYPLVWAGSTQFGFDDLLGAIQEIRDEVLANTTCTVVRTTVAAASVVRTFLSDTTLDIRRVAWLNGLGGATPLAQSDNLEQDEFNAGWAGGPLGTPSAYLRSAQPPLSFDVDALPSGGTYEVLATEAGQALSLAAPAALGVPDDWTWVITFGALAELFGRDGLARDDARASYCTQRYNEGVGLMRAAPALLDVRINSKTSLI